VLDGHRFEPQRTGTAIVMLFLSLVSVPLSLIGLVFLGSTIVGIRELVDAFRIPSIAGDNNNRLIGRLNV